MIVNVTVNPTTGDIGQYLEVRVSWSPTTRGPAWVDISFGDGGSERVRILPPTTSYRTFHAYRSTGTYTISATVTDDVTGERSSGSAVALIKQKLPPGYGIMSVQANSIVGVPSLLWALPPLALGIALILFFKR